MPKGLVTSIEQRAIPLHSSDYAGFRYKYPDDRTGKKITGGYIGLGRQVIARNPYGEVLLDESRSGRRFRPTTIASIGIDTDHHSVLNRWMKDRTEKINRNLGNNRARVIGDFVSKASLEKGLEEGVEFFDLGLVKVEQFFLWQSVAKTFGYNGVYQFQVDTDTESKRPEIVRSVATSSIGQFPESSWSPFVKLCEIATESYWFQRNVVRQDVNHALQVVDKSLTIAMAT